MPAAWSATRTSCSTAWRSDSPHVGFGDGGERAEQRVADVASGGGGQAEQVLGRGVEPGDALQQQVAQAARQLAGLGSRPAGEEFLGEEGVAFGAGDDGVGQPRLAARPARAASSAVSSPGASGPSSSTRPEPERRTPSASRRMRPVEEGSSRR